MLYSIIDATKNWIDENKTKIDVAATAATTATNGKKKNTVCKFFAQGKCRFGVHCINLHPGASTNPHSHSSETEPQTTTSKQRDDKKDSVSPQKKSPKPASSLRDKSEEEEEGEGKKERMRTATEVISRILWDPDLPSEDFTVGYLDRFIGIQEKGFKEFSWEDIASVGADVLAVPKHRIQYFKYKKTIVWDKRSQTDNFFGSRGGKTIDTIVDKPKDDDGNASNESREEGVSDGCGLELMANELEDERPLAHRHGNQPRPTHFVCLRINDEEVKARVQKVIDHVTKLNPQLAEGIIKPTSLHVTVCMIQLSTDEQIETAKRVFNACQLRFLTVLPDCVKMEFTGVDNFRERLIYVKVKPLPGLSKLFSHLIEQFQLAGLKTPGNHEEYTPHITLLRLSRPLQRQLDTKLINPECYRPFLVKDLGKQTISSLHLCSMHAPAQSDGFYLKYATITNSLLGLPRDFVDLVELKLKDLKQRGYLDDKECETLVADLYESVMNGNEIMFDKVLKELVHTNEEVRTFESGSAPSVTVVIVRGLPGSGKSHLCTDCQENLSDPSETAIISADDFFTEGSNYQFNPVTAFKAHQQCITKFLVALKEGKRLVLLDNTNSQQWEYTIYCYLCEVLDIQCHILEIPCPSPSMGERFRNRNQHNVSAPVFTRMLQRWEVDNRAVIVPPSLAYPRDWSNTKPRPFSVLELCEGSFSPLPEVIKCSNNLIAVYSGIFLTTMSQWEVLSMFRPSHNDIHSSHITLSFAPDKSKLKQLPVGRKVQVRITGHAENSKSQACVVETSLRSDNRTSHITISTAEGIPAKSANTMLENQVVRKCDTKVVEGVVGVKVRLATEEEKEGREPVGEKVASMASYIVTSSNDLKTILPRLLNESGSDEATVGRQSERGIITGDQKVTKLYVFDFDGTLAMSPGPMTGRKMYEQATGEKWPHKGWLGWPESLLPPMRVLPGPALAEFRCHVNRAGSRTIILTGRVENTKPGLMKVLENFQIYPDKVFFKPDITDEFTAAFKTRIMKQLLTTENSEVTVVKFWDDLYENLSAMNYLSQHGSMSDVQFEIIDATEMATTSTISKHGKKLSHLKPTSNTIKHDSLLEEHLSTHGHLPTSVYDNAAREGTEFIAQQFSTVIGYEGNPLNLLYVFGSYPLKRASDIDMCLIAPDTHKHGEWIEKMATQLQSCGIKYVHVGHSSRCPRLKIMLVFANTAPIEYDVVIALLPKESLSTSIRIDQLPVTKIAEMRKPGDNATKVALSGPLFRNKMEEVLVDSCVTLSVFGAVVEMVVQILVAKRERGNAYHCMRTFHVVQLLIEFVQLNGAGLPSDVNCDVLFNRFVGFVSELPYDKWEKLFGEFVPEAYIPRLMDLFKECNRLLKPAEPVSLDTYEQLTSRPVYPPNGYIPVDIKISGKNEVLKWKAGIMVEARLPSYVRQIISHGLDVRPDGNVKNTRKYSFSVPPLKSARDSLQQLLRPFWVELADLRKQEGLTIQLNFDQPSLPPSSSPVLEALATTSKDPKASDILEQVTQFAANSSSQAPNQLHLPTSLTSHARLLVHEAAERLGLKHTSIGSGKDRHIVLERQN